MLAGDTTAGAREARYFGSLRRRRLARAAAAFVLFLVLVEFDDRVLQVQVAFIGAAAVLAGSLYALYNRGWGQTPRREV